METLALEVSQATLMDLQISVKALSYEVLDVFSLQRAVTERIMVDTQETNHIVKLMADWSVQRL